MKSNHCRMQDSHREGNAHIETVVPVQEEARHEETDAPPKVGPQSPPHQAASQGLLVACLKVPTPLNLGSGLTAIAGA